MFDKFVPFARERGVGDWQSVTRDLLERYCTWLDDNDYAMATIYLEATTIKQVMKWLAERKLIPTECLFELSVERPEDSDTYCYKPEEVQAILKYCFADSTLNWLGRVVLFLCTTGLRISELVQLRWSDVDFDVNVIQLPDRRRRARKSERAAARSTKGRRGRVLPLHLDLREILETTPRLSDGLILHAAKGGALDDDKIRKILVRDVLDPLALKMPWPPEGEKGFRDGRLHSFRHYFVSVCASSGTPIHVLMTWMGHRDSKMIKYYYHLHAEESQKQMKRIHPAGGADAAWRPKNPQIHPNERSTPEQNGENNGENKPEKTRTKA